MLFYQQFSKTYRFNMVLPQDQPSQESTLSQLLRLQRQHPRSVSILNTTHSDNPEQQRANELIQRLTPSERVALREYFDIPYGVSNVSNLNRQPNTSN